MLICGCLFDVGGRFAVYVKVGILKEKDKFGFNNQKEVSKMGKRLDYVAGKLLNSLEVLTKATLSVGKLGMRMVDSIRDTDVKGKFKIFGRSNTPASTQSGKKWDSANVSVGQGGRPAAAAHTSSVGGVGGSAKVVGAIDKTNFRKTFEAVAKGKDTVDVKQVREFLKSDVLGSNPVTNNSQVVNDININVVTGIIKSMKGNEYNAQEMNQVVDFIETAVLKQHGSEEDTKAFNLEVAGFRDIVARSNISSKQWKHVNNVFEMGMAVGYFREW